MITFDASLSFDTLLLVIVTAMIAYATYLMYVATKQLRLSQIRPMLIAWLREPQKGVGIYVQSVGNGTAFNGKIVCKTASGSTNYEFTRMWVGQIYEYPIAGQPSIAVTKNDRTMTIEMNYKDIEGNEYQNAIEVDLAGEVLLRQV